MARTAGVAFLHGERRVEDGHARFRKRPSLRLRGPAETGTFRVNLTILFDRAALADATDLMARFGEFAEGEAASRADRSRSLGNVVHFCHWRQIERTIGMLRVEDVTGPVH